MLLIFLYLKCQASTWYKTVLIAVLPVVACTASEKSYPSPSYSAYDENIDLQTAKNSSRLYRPTFILSYRRFWYLR